MLLTKINFPVKRTSGFSLMGMTVVVAIIGIVLAVTVPAQMRAGEIQHARTCQENLARLDGAIEAHIISTKIHPGQAIAIADLVKPGATGYLKATPVCPENGKYTLAPHTGPVCSIAHNPNATYAPHIRSEAVPVP